MWNLVVNSAHFNCIATIGEFACERDINFYHDFVSHSMAVNFDAEKSHQYTDQ